MTGRYIDLSDASGATFRAYLAVPASGSGPGVVLCQEIFGINESMREVADYYAEEGYVVLAPDLFWRIEPGIELGYDEASWQRAFELYKAFEVDLGMKDIATTVAALRDLPECTGKVGALGFCLGGTLSYLAATRCGVDAAISYYGVGIDAYLGEANAIACPTVLHVAGKDAFCPPDAQERIRAAFADSERVRVYDYADVDHAFARTGGDHYDKASALMAHQRSIELLREAIGPRYNLSALWDKHTEYEFAIRDADKTMATMVAEPYVNHIPTMTGGVGHEQLHYFYQHHFIPRTPKDTRLIPISRTIGLTQIVDEMVFCFTHDTEVDWMLPGVPPTGKTVEIPLVAIVKFRGDKLYHEHIYWDQASVLAQVGLIDPAGLPVAGAETARKLLDETQPSNTLMTAWGKREGQA
ncbi:dienelactone hydrolase family protein [Pigmentiphaga litoralis]|uniref:Carboxymethylenebutenolidase n=1 Tax=Pigmentiphaga litoralis TaxID=516702 RepID=A0A7Y9IRW5_9BURK|nr:dienelactone hydrolase family protein [Pigmentiphaga litoralis]NYE25172.1 carboxymethylenebutenolidase [Pigmentiphaga litoralis]NYE81214.1 carboxymethylenebutenolidase [Pigmentiphaga litoralis]